jgi:uncharacterized LabA/DUF88 family protein
MCITIDILLNNCYYAFVNFTRPALHGGFFDILSSMATERAIIIIDGNNFYNRKKELGVRKHPLQKFNYHRLAEWLLEGRILTHAGYYIGVVRALPGDTHGQQLRSKQQQLFAHLSNPSQGYQVVRGMLMKAGGIYHEKGVDVRMAVDLVTGACEDTYDTAIIISSDTDLVPAIQLVRNKGKKVIYVGFSHRPTYALQKNADESRLITKTDLESFIDS